MPTHHAYRASEGLRGAARTGAGADAGAVGRMCGLWGEVLGAGAVGPDEPFETLGADSLDAIRVLAAVERAFGRRLPPAALAGATTCRSLAAQACAAADPAADPLVPLAGGAGWPLFLAPGAGGSLSRFETLLREADLGRPVFGLRLPTTGPGDAPPRTIEALAARYAAAVEAEQPAGPVHLAGYSFGGRVAFELARQLAAGGREVGFLGLFDTYGPGYPRVHGFPRRLADHAAALWRLDGRGRRRYLRAAVGRLRRRLRGLPPPGPAPLPLPRLPVVPDYLRDDFRYHKEVSNRYRPGPFPGPVTLFRARVEPASVGTDFSDPCLGWGRLACGGVVVHPVPGDHQTLFDPPHVAALARALRVCLPGPRGHVYPPRGS